MRGPITILGNPGSRRVGSWQAAAAGMGLPAPAVIPYLALLRGETGLDLPCDALLRIESPGEDWEVERALIAAGAALDDRRISPDAARALELDHGRFRFGRERHLGFAALLDAVDRALAERPDVRVLTPPADVLDMSDKERCRARLRAAIPDRLPPSLPTPPDAEGLRAAMADAGWTQVFVKPRFGSSAAGVVAFRRAGDREIAITTLRPATGGRLYNSLRLQRLSDRRDIDAALDATLDDGAVVERWIPKADYAGGCFDVRVLCIGGEPRHTVVRCSDGPITNLHLGNARGDLATLEARHPGLLQRLRATARDAAAAFGGSLSAGADVAADRGLGGTWVFELNAFGEVLPGVVDGGEDAYTAMLRAAMDAP